MVKKSDPPPRRRGGGFTAASRTNNSSRPTPLVVGKKPPGRGGRRNLDREGEIHNIPPPRRGHNIPGRRGHNIPRRRGQGGGFECHKRNNRSSATTGRKVVGRLPLTTTNHHHPEKIMLSTNLVSRRNDRLLKRDRLRKGTFPSSIGSSKISVVSSSIHPVLLAVLSLSSDQPTPLHSTTCRPSSTPVRDHNNHATTSTSTLVSCVSSSTSISAPITTSSGGAIKPTFTPLSSLSFSSTSPSIPFCSSSPSSLSLSSLRTSLAASRFRMLNEWLYRVDSHTATKQFTNVLAKQYHEGFRAVLSKWPCDPLQRIIKWVKAKFKANKVIGDLGCGEGRLAIAFPKRRILSYDLVSTVPHVKSCNVTQLPLDADTLDAAVFCLSLMGTDWPEAVREAHRCLVLHGILKIAEVQSRVPDVTKFVRGIEGVGFYKLNAQNVSSYFWLFEFRKTDGSTKREEKSPKRNLHKNRRKKSFKSVNLTADLLAPCLYKKR